MDKDQVAAILDEIGTLLELKGENSFRCNAYANGGSVSSSSSKPTSASRRGRASSARFAASATPSRRRSPPWSPPAALPFYEDLKKKTPAGLLEMLRLPGLGPKKVKALYDQLGIDDLDKLKAACERGQVAELEGFGAKTQQKILEGHRLSRPGGERVRIDQALPLAQSLLDG